jgi:hypothetical protein
MRCVSGTHKASLRKPNNAQDELVSCQNDSQSPTEIEKRSRKKKIEVITHFSTIRINHHKQS